MADGFEGIKVRLSFDPNQLLKDEKLIQKWVNQNLKIKIPVQLDKNTLKDLSQYIKQTGQIAKQINSIKSPKFDLANPGKEAQLYLNRINSLVTGLKRFNGEVKYTYDALGRVGIQVQNAEGLLKKYTLQWDSTRNVLKQVNRQDTNLSNVNQEKQLQYEQKIRDAIIKKAEAQKQSLELFKSNYLNVKIPGLQGLYKGHTDNDGITQLVDKIKNLKQSANLGTDFKKINQEFQVLQNNAKITAKEMGMLNSHAINFSESMRTALVKFPVWLLAGTLILQPLSQLQQGVQYVYELDKALTDLQKVTNETKEQYQAFANEASQIGYSLARTSVEVVQATASFAKMGYNLNQSKELAKTALIMQNVGDIENASEATNYLISTVKAYNVEAKNSINIIDVLNNVSNRHSVTVRGLAEGLQRSASIMAQSGNTMEQTVALLTSANASIQHPERVANGFKTIALRLRGIDEEGGQVFPKLEGLMNKVGVKIRDTNGEFLSTFDILKQLSGVWGSLDSMTKALITEQVAGKFQANVLQSVLSNFGEAEKTLSDGINSTNSALKENEKYMQSVEARYKQFQVRLENLYKTFLSSDLLKGFLTIGEGLIGVLTKLTTTFGGVTVATTVLASGFLLLSKNFRVFTSSLTSGWATNLMSAITTIAARFGVMSVSIRTAEIAMKGFQVASGLFVSLGIGLILEGVFKLIDGMGEAKRKQDEYFSGLSQSIQTLSTDLIKMNQLVNEMKITKDNERVVEIQKELAQVLPETVSGYTAEGEAIANNIPLIKQMIALKEEELRQKREDLTNKFQVEGEDKFNEIKQQQQELDALNRKKQEILDEYQRVKNRPALTTEANKATHLDALRIDLERVTGQSNELRTELLKDQQEFNNMASAVLSADSSFSKLGSGTLNQLVSNLQNVKGIDISSVFNNLKNTDFAKKVKEYNDELNKLVKDGASKKDVTSVYNKGFKELSGMLVDVTGKALNTKDALNGIFNIPEQAGLKQSIDNSTTSLSNFLQELKPVSEEIAVYNQLLADSKEKKKLNGEEIANLIEKYPSLINAISTEGGVIKINQQALVGLRNERYNDVNATVASVNQKLAVLEAQLRQELNINDTTIKSLALVAQARAKAFQVERQAIMSKAGTSSTDKYDDIIAQGKAEKSQLGQMADNYEGMLKEAENIQKLSGLIKAGNYGVSGGAGGKKKSGGSPRTDKSSEQVQLEKFTSLISKAKTEYNEMIKLLERKANLGIVTGLDIFKQKLQEQEKLVNSLFDLPSTLNQKLKDYQAQLGKYKPNTQQYKAIQGIISLVKADISSLPSEQEKQVVVLQSLKKQMTEIEYLTSKRSLGLKIQLGLLKGFEAEEAKIDLLKTKLDGLFEQSNTINEQIDHNKEQIDANNKIAKDALANRNKATKGSAEWNKWDKINKDAVADNKKLVSLNITLDGQQKSINVTIQDTNKEYDTSKEKLDKIKETTSGIESNLQSVIDRIKELNNNSKDTLIDVGISLSLNNQYGTDLFGKSEDFFDNIKSTVMEKVKGIERLKVDLSNATSEASKQLYDILNNPSSSQSEKDAIIKLINEKDDGIIKALNSAGLTEEDLIKYTDSSFQAVVDLINKQKKEIKDAESLVQSYELELKALEDKVDAQEKLNQLKEKELKITEIQSQIDNVKADKRFEFINEQGVKTLTYDIEKVADLEKQKIEAENDLKEFKYQQDIDNQKKAIQDKIDAQQKYIDEELPKLHEKEMAQFTQTWLAKELGTKQNEDTLTSFVKIGVLDRINLYDQEIAKLKELIALQQGNTNSSQPNLFNMSDVTRNFIADSKNKQFIDNVKAYNTPVTTSTVNNTNIVNIGNMRFEGKNADTMLTVLKDMGITVSANQ